MLWNRRNWMLAGAAGAAGGRLVGRSEAAESSPSPSPLTITDLRITPIALPDPPLLAASGCHGPYYLRNVVEAVTDGGLVGIGETTGGARVTEGSKKQNSTSSGRVRLPIAVFPAP